jgi:hypothetical protein
MAQSCRRSEWPVPGLQIVQLFCHFGLLPRISLLNGSKLSEIRVAGDGPGLKIGPLILSLWTVTLYFFIKWLKRVKPQSRRRSEWPGAGPGLQNRRQTSKSVYFLMFFLEAKFVLFL